MCGFARIRCPDCGEERLLMFSCKTRRFCPSCHSKRREEWGEWIREELLLDVPHRQVVFTVPKILRLFFRFRRKLLNSLCLSAVQALVKFLHTATGLELNGTICDLFTHEVFSLLLREKLIGLPLVQKILRWRHTGFNVHSQVKAQTRSEAERVGKYMIRPLF